MPLLTAAQSRAGLTGLVALFSAIALIATAADSTAVFTIAKDSRDYHGPIVIIASSELGLIALLQLLTWLVPTWRSLWDRLMFDVTLLLAWLWTSCTMSFSALYLLLTYVSPTDRGAGIPSCGSLTVTLVLLHLLGMSSAALALVILAGACTQEGRSVFVLWEMALAPLPEFDHIEEPTYGSTTRERTETPPTKRDKFDSGRLLCYIPLLVCSLGAVGCGGALAGIGEKIGSSPFAIAIGGVSALFALFFIATNQRHANTKKLEVGLATILLAVWPVVAIALALYPDTTGNPCRNPTTKEEAEARARSDYMPTDYSDISDPVMYAVLTQMFAWLAAWALFFRIVGLVFPMPDVAVMSRELPPGPEGQSLLRGEQREPSRLQMGQDRPQAGRHPQGQPEDSDDDPQRSRLLAGREFELGDDE